MLTFPKEISDVSLSPDSANVQVDPTLEKALVWNQDLRIIPLSAGIYLLCYLDRSNIGNAKVGIDEHRQ